MTSPNSPGSSGSAGSARSSGGASSRPRFRRPAILDPGAWQEIGLPGSDPALTSQIAHDTAAVIVRTGRWAADPALSQRLAAITDEVGLDTVADLWAQQPARSLPGVLWRLYALREWVRNDPAGSSADYRTGVGYADVAACVAGAAEPPGPAELRDLTDAILLGVFQGDLAVALERAAAFCRVIAAGRAARGEPASGSGDPVGASAASVQQMGADLSACAQLWRRHELI